MMTDTAVNTAPLTEICWHSRAEDYSVLAYKWYHVDYQRTQDLSLEIPTHPKNSSIGVESRVTPWHAAPNEWRTLPPEKVALADSFIPKTELGRKLWALRQKYIAEGGRLFSSEEIAVELERREGGLD